MKINYKRELFKGKTGLCESVFCAPFENPLEFEEEKWENKRFENLIKRGREFLEFCEIDNCDFVIIPYKWDNRSTLTEELIKESKQKGKKIITLHNDDLEPKNIPSIEEGFIFTTAINSKNRPVNCFSFPAFTGDFFLQDKATNLNRNFSFCGAITHPIRYYVLSILSNCDKIKKNFIIRKGFWAPEISSKETARLQYLDNMINSTFVICMRGAGNFSYRLYETLMMGRIPIIIDSNQVFPFEDIIDYESFSFRICESRLLDLQNILYDISQISEDKIKSMQIEARRIWIEYMSPEGWIKNFKLEICKNNGL